MAYILDISTAVPEFPIRKEDFARFYYHALKSVEMATPVIKKLDFLNRKTKIDNRYSSIPDFNGKDFELYNEGNYAQPIEKRMELYKKKLMPLATNAIDKMVATNHIEPKQVTHLITVSCTGLFAPGFEFLVAEHYGLQHTEKFALNFLGCYAGIKALKQAYFISRADPNACILIVSAELCSLHFFPSDSDEDIIANSLFADGASAVIVCGNNSELVKNKVILKMDTIGTATIPNTFDLMTWNITSSAFKMHLDKQIVKTIRENIRPAINDFLGESKNEMDYWAIHPGGIKIVEAVRDELDLSENNVADSTWVLQNYGNMSSPTILFILSRILNRIRSEKAEKSKQLFSCAFGPGINIEMIRFSSIHKTH